MMPSLISRSRLSLLLWLISYGLIQAGATVANAVLIEIAFDHVLTATDPLSRQAVLWIGLGLMALASLLALIQVVERRDAERLGQGYARDIRLALFHHLMLLSPRHLQRQSHGGILLRFVGDLTAVRQWISLGLARLVVAIIRAIGVLVALSWVSGSLASVVGGALFIPALITLKLGRPLEVKARLARRRLSQLAANITEKISTVAVVQVFGQTQREHDRLTRQSERLEQAMVDRAIVIGQLRAVVEGATLAAFGSVLLIGTYQVHQGILSAGTVVATLTIVGLLFSPLRDLSRVQEYWHSSRISVRKIQAFLNTPTLASEDPSAPDLVVDRGEIEFAQVSVKGVLTDLEIKAEPGQIVAIVGPNGSGKSTLLSLVTRLMDPDSGVIRVDGQELRQCNLASVRRAFGMASPDLPLLRGSVRKNLRYRDPQASSQDRKHVSKVCRIPELLKELPQGEQTRISERGMGLSSGQRQRIMIARALLGDPKILVLDEIDSHLDSTSAQIITKILSTFKGTVLIVTHRLDTVMMADTVWYLAEGCIQETGSPKHLLHSDSLTAQLFRSSSRKRRSKSTPKTSLLHPVTASEAQIQAPFPKLT
jgi:ABC-type multidrug transport system fused ATPase/permease subunit